MLCVQDVLTTSYQSVLSLGREETGCHDSPQAGDRALDLAPYTVVLMGPPTPRTRFPVRSEDSPARCLPAGVTVTGSVLCPNPAATERGERGGAWEVRELKGSAASVKPARTPQVAAMCVHTCACVLVCVCTHM